MQDRVRYLNQAPVRSPAKYVLYWSQMNRRVDSNHALAWAVQLANDLDLPVLFYEGLTCTYPFANDRHHTFILQGVPETARRLEPLGIGYLFYLRRKQSDPNDVLYRLAKDAAVVVTDDYPVFVAAAHNRSVAGKLDAAFHAVDSSCIVPMNRLEKREYAAYTIRPKIRRLLFEYLRPLEMAGPRRRFTQEIPCPGLHTTVTEPDVTRLAAECDIDHGVPPSLSYTGGRAAAEKQLRHFIGHKLKRYAEDRNEPAAHATSNLSPYLHYGQMSSLEIALAAKGAEEFLEELIVRRELAFNYCRYAARPGTLESLPPWAATTLQKHSRDARNPCYTPEQFCDAATHDALWNATQKEMRLRGKIHGYYRMYWGKKIIEWSRTHQEALDTMVRIHDIWAVDGRDPNTYTNILWCFGLHDRPWQERPVFGKVRYMSLEGMRRKTDVDAYIREIEHLEQTGKGGAG
jgi:deoxyribodipyrimidine photo-lyase